MIFAPDNADDLSRLLKEANETRQKVERIDLSRLNRLTEFCAADMTCTVESGMTVAALQQQLLKERQWLPLDPPFPERTSIAELIGHNRSGPRRFGHGTARDYLLGIRVVLGDGRMIKAGGRVVKNVAGYDLCRLFIGSRDTLGILIEATFKLKPLPESEDFVQARFKRLAEVEEFLQTIMNSSLTPTVLDLHNLKGPRGDNSPYAVVLGFSGVGEDVQSQLEQAASLGAKAQASLDHVTQFWNLSIDNPPGFLSLLPSKLVERLGIEAPDCFLAHAGHGSLWMRGSRKTAAAVPLPDLTQSLKRTFDPHGVLPFL